MEITCSGCRPGRDGPGSRSASLKAFGHVDGIKVLKRQMFGRAGFQLLRKRVPWA
jgi:hypothetical protein